MSDRSAPLQDSVRGHWVERLPGPAVPYARLARLDRPIGWWLLMWPAWWSAGIAAIAAGLPVPNPWHLALFMLGAISMRGAGCTYNDIVDRDLDAQVTRTRNRPIPSGQVSVRQAWAFLVALLVVGALVLLQFNVFTILVGLGSLPVILVYPFMKRVMDLPQFVLGLAFTWGAFLGWTAIFGALGPAPLLLYAGGILWTIGYDTIYAHQDHDDDSIIGVRSTARLFGDHTRPVLFVLYAGATALFAAAAWSAGAGWPAFAGIGLGAVHLVWQVATLNPADTAGCLVRFRSNRDYGWIVFAGLVADALLQALT